MTIEQMVALMHATAELIGAVAWPVVGVIIVIRFGGPISGFIGGLAEFGFKAPGFEATGRRQIEAAVGIGAAIGAQSGAGQGKVFAEQIEAAAETVEAASPSRRCWRNHRRISGSTIGRRTKNTNATLSAHWASIS